MSAKTLRDSLSQRARGIQNTLRQLESGGAIVLECGEFCQECHKVSCNIPEVSYDIDRRISEINILCSECGKKLGGWRYNKDYPVIDTKENNGYYVTKVWKHT
jgi:hypothetical protein